MDDFVIKKAQNPGTVDKGIENSDGRTGGLTLIGA